MLCEVQGYVYAAKRLAARAARRLGKHERSKTLDAQATELANRFENAFWCEDLGTYALALDGQKKPCRVRTSNAGQVLFSGIAASERADAVIRDLLRPSFFSGWGIRTVATIPPARLISHHKFVDGGNFREHIQARCSGHPEGAQSICSDVFDR
jgi:glycogen debranching enzyme